MHIAYKCDGRCQAREYPTSCNYCDGGLFLCTVCNAAEGELPAECPGAIMSAEQKLDVYAGRLDYRDGQWVRL